MLGRESWYRELEVAAMMFKERSRRDLDAHAFIWTRKNSVRCAALLTSSDVPQAVALLRQVVYRGGSQ
jgi:hypothetical protein